VVEVPTYRWALPEDTRPLVSLMDASIARRSTGRVHERVASAQPDGRGGTGAARAVVARCAECHADRIDRSGLQCRTRRSGITTALEASPPKLGPMLEALDAAFGRPLAVSRYVLATNATNTITVPAMPVPHASGLTQGTPARYNAGVGDLA